MSWLPHKSGHMQVARCSTQLLARFNWKKLCKKSWRTVPNTAIFLAILVVFEVFLVKILGYLRSRSPISVCLDLRPALWEGWGPWGLWSLLCPAGLSWGLLDAASYAQSKVGTKPYCAPEVLSNLDYKNQALQAEAMVWKAMAASQLASKDVNFIGSFFFAKELGHTLSAQMFGALGFPAAFIVLLW